jgi:hypothetical protein
MIGSCLIVGARYHKNTTAKVERASGLIGDTLRAFANGRKDDSDWDWQLPLAVFAINNAASTVTLDDGFTPFFIMSRPGCPPPHAALFGPYRWRWRG